MISFDRVVAVLIGDVPGRREQLVEHPKVGRCPVRGHSACVGACALARVKNRRAAAVLK